MSEHDSWQLEAFSAFGTMSGFALAALSLVAGVSSHERAKRELERDSGRMMLRMLMHSTFLWFVPAVVALACIPMQHAAMRYAFLIAVGLGCAQGIFSLIALWLFFKTFTDAKGYEEAD